MYFLQSLLYFLSHAHKILFIYLGEWEGVVAKMRMFPVINHGWQCKLTMCIHIDILTYIYYGNIVGDTGTIPIQEN